MGSLKSKGTEILDKAKELFGKQAEIIASQPKKLRALLDQVGQKIGKLARDPRVQKLTMPVAVFTRMIKAHFSGDHPISSGTLGFIVLGLLYFISPIDIIPDFLGVFGFADDASVILAIFARLKDEVEEFLDWERTSGQ